jgi:hypothetical protein
MHFCYIRVNAVKDSKFDILAKAKFPMDADTCSPCQGFTIVCFNCWFVTKLLLNGDADERMILSLYEPDLADKFCIIDKVKGFVVYILTSIIVKTRPLSTTHSVSVSHRPILFVLFEYLCYA